jgi:stearoyl-CoA desaturase (delta-9 desaturase)
MGTAAATRRIDALYYRGIVWGAEQPHMGRGAAKCCGGPHDKNAIQWLLARRWIGALWFAMPRSVSPYDQDTCTVISNDTHDDIVYPTALPFVLFHLSCVAVVWTGVTWTAVLLGVALYFLRIFAIGAGYHRYFSHRAYATSRVFQFLLAVLAQSTTQKSVIWWASKHRHHHLYSDTEQDVHSPRHRGFFYSHVGWIFSRKHDEADLKRVSDLMQFPELRWLHKYEQVPSVALGIFCFAVAGWPGLVVGFVWSTVFVYHATFCINSLAHVRGSTRYLTGDDSRNNLLLALMTMGEGWHNNHHAYQASVRQGFRWWEFDPTYYILKALSWLGIVWDLQMPPQSILRNEQRLGARVMHKAAAMLAAHFDSGKIAATIRSSLAGAELTWLCDKLVNAPHEMAETLKTLHLPALPSREEFFAQAKARLAASPSIPEIVDRARELVLASVAMHLTRPAMDGRPA